LLLTMGLGSESSSSHDVVSSVLIWKLRTLMGDVICFGEAVSVYVGDGTVSEDDDGMLLLEFNLVAVGDDEERVVGRILSGGGLQS
jgi:predicted PP-loop superfamily ATPase